MLSKFTKFLNVLEKVGSLRAFLFKNNQKDNYFHQSKWKLRHLGY